MTTPPLAGRKVQTAQSRGRGVSPDTKVLVGYTRNSISTSPELTGPESHRDDHLPKVQKTIYGRCVKRPRLRIKLRRARQSYLQQPTNEPLPFDKLRVILSEVEGLYYALGRLEARGHRQAKNLGMLRNHHQIDSHH